MGVPLVILHLSAAYSCFSAAGIRPSYPGDEAAPTGIQLACTPTIGFSASPCSSPRLLRCAARWGPGGSRRRS
ncbi:hypothetical protein ACFPN0_20920 [Kitasatospora cinereorecta]